MDPPTSPATSSHYNSVTTGSPRDQQDYVYHPRSADLQLPNINQGYGGSSYPPQKCKRADHYMGLFHADMALSRFVISHKAQAHKRPPRQPQSSFSGKRLCKACPPSFSLPFRKATNTLACCRYINSLRLYAANERDIVYTYCRRLQHQQTVCEPDILHETPAGDTSKR